MKALLIIIGIIVLIGIFALPGYNKIVTLDQDVTAKWSEVENQYQRRSDLIPNLVATVKGYATHEQQTLEGVIQARANATKITVSADQLSDPAAIEKFQAAQGQLSMALGRLLAVSENYPNLKANDQFIALQSQLEGTENRITVARKDYIDTVQQYNTTIRSFPGLIWAKFYGAKPKANFTATTVGAETAPKVQF